MTSLGKKPPELSIVFSEEGLDKLEFAKKALELSATRDTFLRTCLLEAADKLEPHTRGGMSAIDCGKLAKKLRISAGEEK